ncbi:efflux RND transporter periplasmic adaptor subunit [Schnuerera sp. xch1]|uniref:efflux RND transporter periplasmic adaptor subunit n=1 Tax=Schnuerera sp. xch1 TaxID=2874283 RepID=UPI001CC0882F|nr:efflux RND transporter periplasmic adaptor subunit [Schnuerera sp. xch1]MBZ2173995.1 efflux RND transporter periplasmic adaptor subunit [Schnuerera sp. xch1]
MKKRIVGIMLILSIVTTLFTGCKGDDGVEAKSSEHEKQEAYTPVEVSKVARKTLANITTINGKVSGDKNVMVVPTVPGTVETIAVKDGDRVKKGDVLFTLDEKDIRKQVDQAKAAYDMAKANYDMSQEQSDIAQESLERTEALTESVLQNARENLENTKKLYEAGAVSKSELDQAELALEQQESQMQAQLDQAKMGASDQVMEVAKSQLEQAEVAYQQAQDALNNATITSPIDGVVTGISIEVGSMASNAQPAMNVVDMDRVYVKIDVVEGLINQLTEGQEVNVAIPAVSSEPFNVVIDNIIPSTDARTQLYPVKIYLDNSDGTIKPGMFADVEIALNVKDDVLSVASEAVIVKDQKNIVYIIEDDKAIEKEVKIGLDTGTEVEILEGLKENDTIIISGHNYVEDGGAVKVVGGTE